MKFLEIERKYSANTVNKEDFVKLCKGMKPYKMLSVSGPDTYYENDEGMILRWRRSFDLNQLTTKSRFTKRTSLVREEVEVDLTTKDVRQIISFIKALSFRKIFRIRKQCEIFWFRTEMGEVSVVYYEVQARGFQNRTFIEIEAEKGQSMETSKDLIRKWEEVLSLKEHWRLNKTLLELYSDRDTRLIGATE